MTDENSTTGAEASETTEPETTDENGTTGAEASEPARPEMIADTTVVEHTGEAMFLRDGATVARDGGLGEDGEVLTGQADEQEERKQLDGPATDEEKNAERGR